MQNDGFLGGFALIGIPLIWKGWLQIYRTRRASKLQIQTQTSDTALGAGLQINLTPRTYRRIPIVDLK